MLLRWAATFKLAFRPGRKSGLLALAPRGTIHRFSLHPSRKLTVAWLSFGSGKMPPGTSDKKPEKSYLSSAVDSINPWATSRTTTPTPDDKRDETTPASPATGALGDHSIKPLYGQSFRTYPRDCPPLNVQWFHAVDVRPAQHTPSSSNLLISYNIGSQAKARDHQRPSRPPERPQTSRATKEVYGLLAVRFAEAGSSIPEAVGSGRGQS